jgi:hypothetical protein
MGTNWCTRAVAGSTSNTQCTSLSVSAFTYGQLLKAIEPQRQQGNARSQQCSKGTQCSRGDGVHLRAWCGALRCPVLAVRQAPNLHLIYV